MFIFLYVIKVFFYIIYVLRNVCEFFRVLLVFSEVVMIELYRLLKVLFGLVVR